MSTEVTPAPSQELSAAEQQAVAAALGGIDKADLILPMLKVTQQLTREVTDGVAQSGVFLNSLTGTDYGDTAELVVAHVFKGRLYSPDSKDKSQPGDPAQTYVAGPVEIVPSNWPDEWAGQRFDDLPLAEEQWKARANDPDDDFQFGSGPPVQTTHNFIGFVVDDPDVPVRLSLKSSSSKTARKIVTLLSMARTPWSSVISLSTLKRENAAQQPYFIVQADRGRQTTADEQAVALELAQAIPQADITYVGDEGDEKRERKAAAEKQAEGALDV